MFTSPLRYLNVDIRDSGISLALLTGQLLVYLPRLQSFVYQYSGKALEDVEYLIRLSNQIQRIQFIRKDLPINIDWTCYSHHNQLVTAIQEINYSKTSRQALVLHTTPYPDRTLSLPFIQWTTANNPHLFDRGKRGGMTDGMYRYICLGIYDRVRHVRVNLSDWNVISNFPRCRHVSHLTIVCTNESQIIDLSIESIASFVCLSSIRHLIINTQTCSINFNQLVPLMSLQSLEISWSQFHPYSCWSKIKNLSLINEYVGWKDINYLINNLIPQLEHLRINVTTSEECQKILDILLSPLCENQLISMKICICQTLSDQIEEDLQPRFSSSQWLEVKFHIDHWYLHIWK